MKTSKRLIAGMLVMAMCLALLAGCGDKAENGSAGAADDGATYTYNNYLSGTPTSWNSHDVEVVESITEYTESYLWQMVLNATADGYEWVCDCLLYTSRCV